MAVYYNKEKIAEIVQQYAGDEKNTGNTEAQIALLTKVGQRKSLLSYYAKKDIYKYRALIEKLGLRK